MPNGAQWQRNWRSHKYPSVVTSAPTSRRSRRERTRRPRPARGSSCSPRRRCAFRRSALPLGPVAESVGGASRPRCKALARETKIWILAGMFERADGDERAYNTLVLVDDAGGVRGTYRKIHLYDAFGYRESDRLVAGEGGTLLFEIDGVRFGALTCYDVRFPEQARHLVRLGAQAIVFGGLARRSAEGDAVRDAVAGAGDREHRLRRQPRSVHAGLLRAQRAVRSARRRRRIARRKEGLVVGEIDLERWPAHVPRTRACATCVKTSTPSGREPRPTRVREARERA